MTDEKLDRRLFLRGLMLTSAGLIVPKPKYIVQPLLPKIYRGANCIVSVNGLPPIHFKTSFGGNFIIEDVEGTMRNCTYDQRHVIVLRHKKWIKAGAK